MHGALMHEAAGWADQPGPEPMAPDRWAPQSWEAPSWVVPVRGRPPSGERASWDSETARPAGWLDPPGAAPEWAEHRDPLGLRTARRRDASMTCSRGPCRRCPLARLPGSGHPSGPLPPLPDSDYLWGEPPSGPLPAAAPGTRPPGHDQERSRGVPATPRRRRDRARPRWISGGPGWLPGERGPDTSVVAPAGTRKTRPATRTIPLLTCLTGRTPAEQPDPRGRGPPPRRAARFPQGSSGGMRATWTIRVTWTWPRIRGRKPRDFASSGNWYQG